MRCILGFQRIRLCRF